MKKILLIAIVTFISTVSLQAQKKKDLLKEIDKLRLEINTTKSELNDAKNKEKAVKTQIETMESQMTDLKETNNTLLGKMSSFTQLSNKKAKNLETSLVSLQLKDKQIKTINDAISKRDSLKLTALTVFKNTLGGDGKVSLKNGVVYLTLPNTTLFGANDTSVILTSKAKEVLSRIATTLNAQSEFNIIVEGNSNALKFKNKSIDSNWDLSALQAATVVSALQNDYSVDPKRMEVLGKSEYGMSSIETVTRIIIDPKFDQFYDLIKENMKNQ